MGLMKVSLACQHRTPDPHWPRIREMKPSRRNSRLGPPPRSARQQALTEWRGLDLAPLEKVADGPAKSVEQVMPGVLRGLRMERRQAEAEIVRVWNHLLDPVVTRHAQPTGLHKGTLFVNVDSNVWLDEIVRYRRREILERLRHSFGKGMIQRISFRVGG